MDRPLSSADAQFVEDQRLDERWIYERRGRERLATALAAMRDLDKWVLHGFPKCGRCKISLKSRKGDCLNCSKQLEHVFRYTEPGCVYILRSAASGLVKVGSTQRDASVRARQLNQIGYGGASDWTVAHSQMVWRCGLFEDWFKSALTDECENIPYERYGTPTYTRETYRCSPAKAKAVFVRSLALYTFLHAAADSGE